MNQRVFILEDDADIVRIVSDILSPEGYSVSSSASAKTGLKKIEANPPDLILLDIRLPDTDGFEVCRLIKAQSKLKHIPIIIISAKTDEFDVVTGLELGAEDYVKKPFQRRELLARIKAALRRKNMEPEPQVLTFGPLKIDLDNYAASVDGKDMNLAPKEFELLAFFTRKEGRVLTRTLISESVWGIEHLPTSRTIDYHVYQIRKKLGAYGRWIKFLKGIGYRFEFDEEG